jgi:hypothetical protein
MSYSMKFGMCANPWNTVVIAFDDGVAKLHKHRLRPDVPVLVWVEGPKPTSEQIEACRRLWSELYAAMDFSGGELLPGPSILLP